MENETEIFRKWLHKFIGVDKKMKAKELAGKIGIPAPRITQYHLGRVDNGVRTFPHIPFEIRQAILEATDTDYEIMMEIGRRELQPPQDEIRKIVKEEIAKQVPPRPPPPENVVNYQSLRNAEHHQKINEFQDQETALQINNILVKIESLAPEVLKKIAKTLQIELDTLEETKGKDTPGSGKPGEKTGKRA